MANQLTFEAIGTTWDIELLNQPLTQDSSRIFAEIRTRIADFDHKFSRFRDDSLIAEIARRQGAHTLPAEAQLLFDVHKKLYDITDGAFSPLVGNTMVDAGYDALYSLQAKTSIRSAPPWDVALDYRFPVLTVKKPVLLDFGAGGKGYLADLVAACLREFGIENYCINAGGDIVYKHLTCEPLCIALEDPFDTTMAIGVAKIENGSLSGSAGNRRAWAGFHHIINPKTGISPSDIAAVWVYAKDGLLSDSISTALFLSEPKKITPIFDFEYAIIRSDRSLEHSAHFPAEFFVD
jgi:thiamine biosynthesis lipoprotein